ncbi:MAG: N-acetylmuramoyl-L-alanine amidase [Bacteroidia bacterium]|nr:N-acetylmuramoyl-L-alanine amidase [Bacteroidia bacterium]
MRVFATVFIFLCFCLQAQTIKQCQQRFSTYLNFHGSLNGSVKFSENSLSYFNPQGKKEYTFYEEELPALSLFFEQSTPAQQEALLRTKGLKPLSKKQLDSLYNASQKKYPVASDQLMPLKGMKIALDPGHFSTNLADAQAEQKFLFFVKDSASGNPDTVKLFESLLTFHTATILKGMLEEQGAIVFMSRNEADHTSFGCNFKTWMRNHRKRTLDSLLKAGNMPPEKHRKLQKCNEYTFFWDFFRDYDLANRAKKINDFQPDITVIIHYNVDEKNAPWKQHTKKNFSMAFIGGAYTNDNLSKTESKMHFLRMLLSDQLNRSEVLSAYTVRNFNSVLSIAIAKSQDASYLKDNCLETNSPGVFCRNLVLCRKINSVLVYGESLYQDNENESRILMRSDKDLYGVKTNERVMNVARSYYNGLMEYAQGIKR